MEYKLKQYMVGSIGTNCYFMINADTNETIVIDPGASGKELSRELKGDGCVLKAVLLTHGHYDHAGGVADLLGEYEEEIPVYAHENEKETLKDPMLNLSGNGYRPESYQADHFLKDGEVLKLAGFSITVLHTPGHTEGGCCFYFPEEKVLFSGDSLFCESIGRTDFPRGSMSELVRSVKEKLLVLPEDVNVYPGHDAATTIGNEKRYNPFLS